MTKGGNDAKRWRVVQTQKARERERKEAEESGMDYSSNCSLRLFALLRVISNLLAMLMNIYKPILAIMLYYIYAHASYEHYLLPQSPTLRPLLAQFIRGASSNVINWLAKAGGGGGRGKGILCLLPAEAPARLSAVITLPQLILTRSHTRKQKTRLKRVQIV